MRRPRRQWRGHEFEQLWLRYPSEGPNQLAIDLGRTTGAIDAVAARLRLRSLNRRTRQVQTFLRNRSNSRYSHIADPR